MWEPLVSYAVALIAGAIGGVVGGYFGIAAVNRSHKLSQEAQTERERELSDRVRAMLMIEIEENRQAFERYDAGIDDRVLFMGGKYQPQERAEQLSSIPLPTWKHSYWDALTPSIPNALTVEEIQRCHQFHSGLDELTRIKNVPHNVQGDWFTMMDQTMRKLKELKNPFTPDETTKKLTSSSS